MIFQEISLTQTVATKNTDIEVVLPDTENSFFKQEVVTDVKAKWLETLSDLNVCSPKGTMRKV